MFNKKKSEKDTPPDLDTGITEKDPTTASIQSPSSGQTVIGKQIAIEGDIHGRENLFIEGSMKGKIQLDKSQLTVGQKGRVEAEINADSVTISGRLAGNINAMGQVAITKEAHFTGEIKAKSISVEDGAYLSATINLDKGLRE